jgi:hypothetical protein
VSATGGQQPAGIFRVACLKAFKSGADAVLAAMDAPGLDIVTSALNLARRQGFSRLDCQGRIHVFRMEVGAADIDLRDNHDDHVEWRLDPGTADDMIGKLTGMRGSGLCHNYVDICTPAETLVLSLDEYLEPNAVVHTSPFGYF